MVLPLSGYRFSATSLSSATPPASACSREDRGLRECEIPMDGRLLMEQSSSSPLPSAFSLSLNPLQVSSIDLATILSYQSSNAFIALLLQMSQSPSVLRQILQLSPPQLLSRLSGPDRFSRRVQLSASEVFSSLSASPAYDQKRDPNAVPDAHKFSSLLPSPAPSVPLGHWRPPYEYLPPLVQSSQSSSCSLSPSSLKVAVVVRSRSHIGWCRFLLFLVHLGRSCDPGQQDDSCPKLPSHSSHQSSRPQRVTLMRGSDVIVDSLLQFYDRIQYVMTATKQSSQLALLEEFAISCQLLSQVPSLSAMESVQTKIAVFRLAFIGLKSIQPFAVLILGRGQIEVAEVFQPKSIIERQAAGIHLDQLGHCSGGHVPSIYHQRTIVLTVRIIVDLFKCFSRFTIKQIGASDLQLLSQELLQLNTSSGLESLPCYLNLRHSQKLHPNPITTDPIILSSELLEALFHDVIDLGRLVFQLLEDLLKLERQVFIGVRTHSSHILLPLSLSLRCEEVIPFSSYGNPYDHITTSYADLKDAASGISTPRSHHTMTWSPPWHADMLAVDTPPPTPRLTLHTDHRTIPSDAQTVISRSRAGSPLIQRYAAGTPCKQKTARGASPIMQFCKLARIQGRHADSILEGCLPEFIQVKSLIKLLQNTVEASLVLGTELFGRMLEETRHLNQSFDRPSVVRRLSEFFTAVKGSLLDRFKNRDLLFKKMMTRTARSLGDVVSKA